MRYAYLCLALVFAGQSAYGAIVSVNDAVVDGAVVVVASPPADFSVGNWESSTEIPAFVESQSVKLSQPIPVGISIAGISPSGGGNNLSQLELPSGAIVDSYFVHFDPVGALPQLVLLTGSITFDAIVVGLVSGDQLPVSNNILGLPGVVYDTGVHELNDGGWIALSSDRKTVSFRSSANVASDNFRIITATPNLLTGDANLDGIVDAADYTLWADNFLATRRSWTQGDFSGDQTVDAGDYTLWADNFDPHPATLAMAVPEPSTFALFGMGALALLAGRRRLRRRAR